MCKDECWSNTQLRRNYLLLELLSLAFSTYVDLNGYGHIIYYKTEIYYSFHQQESSTLHAKKGLVPLSRP